MDQPVENDESLADLPPSSDVGLPTAEEMESLDDESVVDDDDVFYDRPAARKRRSLMCFDCNRPEGHFLVSGQRWFFSFLLGLTFGGILLVGPYKCQCCGSSRLMYFDALNPRYWFNTIHHRNIDKSRKRSRSKRKF